MQCATASRLGVRRYRSAGADIARIYDHLLGGSHNFAADRAWAGELERRLPGITQATWANRAFLRRVITYCADAGITQ